MRPLYFIIILGITGLTLFFVLKFSTNNTNNQPVVTQTSLTETKANCLPTFVDGGGPYYKENSPMRAKIVPNENNGQKLLVAGKIIRSDCKTIVGNAILDIWQANETGDYQDEWYRGKVVSDQNGNYSFETVVPKGYGEGTGYRPPHIHFKVFINDQHIITSQMFFPEAKGKPGFEDDYIMKVTETKNDQNQIVLNGYHDIILPE